MLHFLYDIVRLDERLLLKEFQRRNIGVTPVNVQSEPVDVGPRDAFGFVRVASRYSALLVSYLYEAMGPGSINGFTALALAHDKFVTHVALARHGVDTPRSYLALSERAMERGSAELGFPSIVKPTDGSWGRFVSLVRSPSDLATLARHRRLAGKPAYIVQEFVNKPNRDIRAIVVEDRMVGAIYRINEGDWRTNTARGSKAVPVDDSRELEEVAVRASRAVGALYSGVDLVESERGYLVLEINGVPEFKNVQGSTGTNIAGEIVEAAYRHAKR